jgi:hypothetical protein
MLTDDEVEQFRKDGYLLPQRQLFSEERLSGLEAIFNEHLADKGDKLSDELDTPHYRDARLLDFLLSDEVLDWIEPLTGPDIALWSSHFISKDPFTGRETPWHEDSAFWEGRFDSYDSIVTIWLALEDGSFRENGCMRVIPGSMVGRGFSSGYVPTDITEKTFHAELSGVDESQAVYFELERGRFSMHDGRIVHGAAANTSPVRRTGYTMRYFPSSVKMQDVPQNEGWQIWLARGRDLAGNRYANVPADA